MSEHAKYEMSTEEIMFRSDVRDTFQENADIMGISLIPADGGKSTVAMEVLAGWVTDMPELVSPTLTLSRMMTPVGERLLMRLGAGAPGEQEHMFILLNQSNASILTLGNPTPTQALWQALRGELRTITWDAELSQSLAEQFSTATLDPLEAIL